MKQLVLALALIAAAPAAHAQPPELPKDLIEYLDSIEREMAIKRFGPTQIGWLEEEEEATLVVEVSPDKDTFVQVVCNSLCEAIYAYAENGAGENIDSAEDDSPEPVLFIPAGTGANVSVTVTMGYCDDFDCQYAVQAFVR